jgi:hypothetical protein
LAYVREGGGSWWQRGTTEGDYLGFGNLLVAIGADEGYRQAVIGRAIGVETAAPRFLVLLIAIVGGARIGAAIGSDSWGRTAAAAMLPMILGEIGLAHPMPAELIALGDAAELAALFVAIVLTIENWHALNFSLAVFEAEERIPLVVKCRRRDGVGGVRGLCGLLVGRRGLWGLRWRNGRRLGLMIRRTNGPRDGRRDHRLRHDQLVAAAIKGDATIDPDMILAAALDGMRVDVESTDDAPAVEDTVVQVAAGE